MLACSYKVLDQLYLLHGSQIVETGRFLHYCLPVDTQDAGHLLTTGMMNQSIQCCNDHAELSTNNHNITLQVEKCPELGCVQIIK